jgi:hypothetical protein
MESSPRLLLLPTLGLKMTNLPAGNSVQGGISHLGAVVAADEAVALVWSEDFDGRVKRGTNPLFSLDFGGDDGGDCERLSFDIDVIFVASADALGTGVA